MAQSKYEGIQVELWLIQDGKWLNAEIKFHLDPNDPVCQARAFLIRDYEYKAFKVGFPPPKYNPIEVPKEIYDMPSRVESIRANDERSRRIFSDSSEFFIRVLREDNQKRRNKIKPIPIGTNLERWVKEITSTKRCKERSFKSLVSLLEPYGYHLNQLKGGDIYIIEEPIFEEKKITKLEDYEDW